MSPVIKGVLQEELDRSLSLKKRYEKKLAHYPPGYLLVRKKQDKIYYYLSYREKGRMPRVGPQSDQVKSVPELGINARPCRFMSLLT